jgi:hypothetical protein
MLQKKLPGRRKQMLHRLTRHLRHGSAAMLLATIGSLNAQGATIEAVTPSGGLGQLEFKLHKMNQVGDFVAVSNTRVYVGNGKDRTHELVFTTDRSSFVLGEYITLRAPYQDLRVSLDVLQTRLAINNNGDFVLASNNFLWTGNTRTKAFKQVADGGAFTGFQTVAINDAGHYLAVGYEKIFGGLVSSEQATLLLEEAVGSFSMISLYESTNYVDSFTGESRVALNSKGEFMALTNSAVYYGNVTAAIAAVLVQERFAGFRHVSLADDGQFTLVSDNDIYAGSLAE